MPRLLAVMLAVGVLLGAAHVQAQEPERGIPAQIVHTPDTVNAYVLPDANAPLMLLLNGGARITALGRTADNAWIEADVSDGYVGWVAYQHVVAHYAYDLAGLPVTQADTEMILQFSPFWNFDTPHNLAIFQRGQASGKQMNMFAKVGDSITVSPAYLTPLGYGVYDLGTFEHLQHVLDYFGTGEESAFYRSSAAVYTGWSTRDVLNVKRAQRFGCPQGYTPLACEYGTKRPAFALIMLGTNDATIMDVTEFEANLNQIVEVTIGADIVPVLSTVPPLLLTSFDEKPFNHAIIRVAQTHDISVINYWLAMQPLPNYGMSSDMVHPSAPANNAGTTLFTGEYIQYGYTMRNLVTLQGLDLLLQNAVYPAF